MIACGLYPSGKSGIAWGQQNPPVRDGQDFAISGMDGVRGGTGGEGLIARDSL
jgi:hypothetical protein